MGQGQEGPLATRLPVPSAGLWALLGPVRSWTEI